MEKLIFPPFEHRIKIIHGKKTIFDVLRKKYIVLTPEEWVRQHLIHYLINYLHYPKPMMSAEDSLKFNKMMKRSDLIVYNRYGKVFLAVECKAEHIKLGQKSMNQLSVYNQHYKAQYLALTNGKSLIVCQMDYLKNSTQFLDTFPKYA